MNPYLLFIIILLVTERIFSFFKEMHNLKHFSLSVPEEFADIYDKEKYKKSQQYLKTNTIFGEISSFFSLIVILAFIVFGGFAWITRNAQNFSDSLYLQSIYFLLSMIILSTLLSIPFSVYSTFVIEEKFGFNKTTIKTFILDIVKTLILSSIIGIPVFMGITWFFENVGLAWLWAWLAFIVFQMFLVFIAPIVILPMFNKFTDLEEGELRDTIQDYAEKQNFNIKGIFKIDGSKRSTKSNAYFTGFGKTKRIAFYDTAIDNHSVKELLSIFAHEVGHCKLGHIKKTICFTFFSTLIMFLILSFFINQPGLYEAFGLDSTPIYAGIVFFLFIFTPVNMALGLIGNMISRKHEYEADAFAAKTTGNSEHLISGLKKLSVDNLSNLTPSSLKVFVDYSHPPTLARIKALKSLD